MRGVLLGLCLHQLPLHQVPGDPGLHHRHRPLRHQRLLRVPVVLGRPQTAVCRREGGGSHTEHHRHLPAGLHGLPGPPGDPHPRHPRIGLGSRDRRVQSDVQEGDGRGQLPAGLHLLLCDRRPQLRHSVAGGGEPLLDGVRDPRLELRALD